MATSPASRDSSQASGLFPQTMWSMIVNGGDREDPARSRSALEEICRRYWLPAQRFVRSLGCSVADAEDITQNFFAHWAHPETLARMDPGKGRLRSYMKQSLRRFYISEWRKKTAARRGSDAECLSLDELGDLPDTPEGDDVYDAAWAEALVRNVLDDLALDYRSRDKGVLFDAIRAGLPGGDGLQPYAEIAVQVGMTEPQIKLAVHRLRRRFADRLQDEVAQTTTDPEETDDELRYLLKVMARHHGSAC